MSLESLLEAIRREADERRDELLARARAEADELVARARRRAEARLEEHRRRAERDARDEARARLAEARGEARRRVLGVRTDGLERVFREARRLLPDAAGSEAYRASLSGVLAAALAHLPAEGVSIACTPGLEEPVRGALSGTAGDVRGETAEAGTDGGGSLEGRVDAVTPDEGVTAGFRARGPDDELVVDATLEAALDRLRPRLAIELVARVEDGEKAP